TVRLAYRGLDRLVRTTLLTFEPQPQEMTAGAATYRLTVPAGGRLELSVAVTTSETGARPENSWRLPAIVHRRREENQSRYQQTSRITTSHEGLSGWLRRSRRDLHMLLTEPADGSLPYAGTTWYVAPFGRDSML